LSEAIILASLSKVEASNIAYDYALTNRLRFLKNKRAGSVPNLNYVHDRPLSYNQFDQAKSGITMGKRKSFKALHAVEPCGGLSLFPLRTFRNNVSFFLQ
jgi:hypothetical protein